MPPTCRYSSRGHAEWFGLRLFPLYNEPAPALTADVVIPGNEQNPFVGYNTRLTFSSPAHLHFSTASTSSGKLFLRSGPSFRALKNKGNPVRQSPVW